MCKCKYGLGVYNKGVPLGNVRAASQDLQNHCLHISTRTECLHITTACCEASNPEPLMHTIQFADYCLAIPANAEHKLTKQDNLSSLILYIGSLS